MEHASLWVQIWDAPLDMVSPSVAEEVGSRLGTVEEVEKKNQDDQNMFMRVRMELPISKPIRRGCFLASSEGHCTCCNFKYKRLPLYCHHCGLLGHDLGHCAIHFAVIRNEGEVKCQYGDWLRALGGRPRSPPKWTTASPPRSTNRGDGAEEVGSEERGGQQRRGTSLAAAGVNIENTWKNGSSGGSEILGITFDTQQNLSIILDENMLHKESTISNPTSNVTSFSNLNINFDHVQSSCGLPTTIVKPKWCRMV